MLDMLENSGISQERKKSKWPLIIFIIMLIIISLFAILALNVFRASKKLMQLPPKDYKLVSSHLMPNYDNVTFSPPNSELKLDGWFFKCQNEFRGNILFLHDNRANKLQFDLESAKLFAFFQEQGFNVFTFDMRHSGLSEGDSSSYGFAEYKDVLGALQAMQKLSAAKDFILYGLGTGVNSALFAWDALPEEISPEAIAESKNPEALISRKDIKGFIFDTPSSSSYDYIQAELKQDSFVQKHLYYKYIPKMVRISSGGPNYTNLIPLIGHIEVPIMITRNIPDNKIKQSSIDAFISECIRLKSESVFISGTHQAGHLEGFLQDPEQYLEDLTYFLNIYF